MPQILTACPLKVVPLTRHPQLDWDGTDVRMVDEPFTAKMFGAPVRTPDSLSIIPHVCTSSLTSPYCLSNCTL